MAERTVRVPDEMGWWWCQKKWSLRIERVYVVNGQVLGAQGNEPYRIYARDGLLWRGPIPEPTPEQWEMSE